VNVTVRTSGSSPDWLVQLPGFRYFAVFWGSMVAVDLGRLLSSTVWASTVLLAGIVCLCSRGQRPALVAAAGVTGWLFLTGFVVNDGGALTLTGAADAGRLFLLLTCAGLGAALPTLTRS
jgi:hypothetical protein